MAGGQSIKQILAAIDHDENKTNTAMETAWTKFDKDKSGSLHGAEFKDFMAEVTKYVTDELIKAKPSFRDTRGAVENFIKDNLDKNKDGKCSKQEFMANLKKVLDQVDFDEKTKAKTAAGGQSIKQLLATIDHDQDKTNKAIEAAWTKFDKDKSGTLQGAEFKDFISEITNYVTDELVKAKPSFKDTRGAVENFMRDKLDKNKDGICSKQEFMANLKNVLDQVDFDEKINVTSSDATLIELVYFNIHSAGELTRLCFAAVGRLRDLIDTRLPLFMESEEAAFQWSTTYGPESPFGYLPYLKVQTSSSARENITYEISGDGVVETFVARHLKLLGDTPVHEAICSTITVKCVGLLGPELTRAGLFNHPEMIMNYVHLDANMGQTLFKVQEYILENCSDFARRSSPMGVTSQPCQPLEMWGSLSFGKKYLVANRLTLADLAVFNVVDECIKGPRSQLHFKKVDSYMRKCYPVLMKIYDQVSVDLTDYIRERQRKFTSYSAGNPSRWVRRPGRSGT